MSFANANSKFPRLLTMGDADRDQHGGLAALPDEAPNGASVGDVDVADAPLGTLGITPTGVIWQKIAMTTGIQWAPLAGVGIYGAFVIGFDGATDGQVGTWTAPFDCEIVGVRSVTTGDNNQGAFTIAGNTSAGAAGTWGVLTLNGTAGTSLDAATSVNNTNRFIPQGDVLTSTYAANQGAATSPILWVLVRPLATLIPSVTP